MPNAGDKMYVVREGVLVTAFFVEESLAHESCTVTTYLLRESGRSRQKFRCSKDMYTTTEMGAWLKYREELEQALPQLVTERDRAEEHIRLCQQLIAKTNQATCERVMHG